MEQKKEVQLITASIFCHVWFMARSLCPVSTDDPLGHTSACTSRELSW